MKIIILDFETSGLNPYHDDIIEIAMKVMGSDKQYTALLRPKSNEMISETITNLTGITNKILKEKGLSWEEAYKSANDWLLSVIDKDDSIAIVSHNGESFDFIFLRRLFYDLKELGIKTPSIHKIIFIDTLLLTKRLIPGRSSYRQSTLCFQYNIDIEGSHRAMNDVIALEQLFIVYAEQLNKQLNKRRNVFDHPQMIQDYTHYRI